MAFYPAQRELGGGRAVGFLVEEAGLSLHPSLAVPFFLPWKI